jgi:hypothetical protein
MRFYRKSELIEISSNTFNFGTGLKFPDKNLILDCPSVTQVTTAQMLGGLFGTGDALLRAQRRGTLIHHSIELLLENKKTEEILAKEIKEINEEAFPFWKNVLPYISTIQDVTSIEGFCWYDFKELAKQINRFSPYVLDSYDSYYMRGSYDCHCLVNNKLKICDWKTSKNTKNKKGIINYLVQVSFYAVLASKTYQLKVEEVDIVMIYPHKECDVITLDIKEINYYANIFLRHMYNYYENFYGKRVLVGDKYSNILYKAQ